MSSLKHLPCPFCGRKVSEDLSDTLYPSGNYKRVTNGHTHYVSHKNQLLGDIPCWQFLCPETQGGCGAEMHADTREEVISKWNKRPPKTTPELNEGQFLIAVDATFNDLMYWVERAVDKGNANFDIETAFEQWTGSQTINLN